MPVLQQSVIPGDALHYLAQDFGRGIRLSGDLRKRYRIGRIAQELPLVQVDTRARYGAADVCACQVVFNQGAAYLFVFPINVIGPFDADVFGVR